MGREWSFLMGDRSADGQHLVRRWRRAACDCTAADAAEYDAEASAEDSLGTDHDPDFRILLNGG